MHQPSGSSRGVACAKVVGRCHATPRSGAAWAVLLLAACGQSGLPLSSGGADGGAGPSADLTLPVPDLAAPPEDLALPVDLAVPPDLAPGPPGACGNLAGLQAKAPWPMYGCGPTHAGLSPFVGPQKAQRRWGAITGNSAFTEAAVGADGTVFAGGKPGFALAPHTGKELWLLDFNRQTDSAMAIGRDGSLYVGLFGQVSAFSSHTGKLLWSYPTFSDSSSVTVGPDGSLYFGTSDGHLYALSGGGQLRWIYRTDGAILGSPALGDDGALYFASDDGNLYSLRAIDAKMRWSYRIGQPSGEAVPVIGSDNTVYLAASHLYAFDGATGKLKWQRLDNVSTRGAPALGPTGTIYAAGQSLYAVSPFGNTLWRLGARPGGRFGTPAVGADDTVYTVESSGVAHALDGRKMGSEKWSLQIGDPGTYGPSIGADGTLYFSGVSTYAYHD